MTAIIDGRAETFLVVVTTRARGGGSGSGERRFVGPPHLVTLESDGMWGRPADPGAGR